jgi:hypothetical protein
VRFGETYAEDPSHRELEWSGWVSFTDVLDHAPRLPGVYRARQGVDGPIVYIGMAGERNGSGGRPQGLRGRLSVYASGKGLASGLGEAVFDRALADENWIGARLAEVTGGRSRRAKSWGVQAFIWADLHLSWVTSENKASALSLERKIIESADHSVLWNRAGVTPTRRAKASAVVAKLSPALDPPVRAQAPLPPPRRPDEQVAMVGSPDEPRTQRVTAADLRSGQIRIPSRNKWAFPAESCILEVVILGETTICRWNPNGHRSGILRPPSSLLRELVSEDTRLCIGTNETPMQLSQ